MRHHELVDLFSLLLEHVFSKFDCVAGNSLLLVPCVQSCVDIPLVAVCVLEGGL